MQILIMVIFLIVFVVCLIMLIHAKREVKSLITDLDEILSEETNLKLHSRGSSEEIDALIQRINNLLEDKRMAEISFNEKKAETNRVMTNISHDLRTPLTSAIGYVDILRNSDMPEEEKLRELSVVSNRLTQVEEMLNSFFELTKAMTDDSQIEKEDVNLISLIEESISHYYDKFDSENRRIDFKSDTKAIMINTNKSMFMRISDNLINNAFKHGEGDLEISIALPGEDETGFIQGKVNKEASGDLLPPDGIQASDNKIILSYTNRVSGDIPDMDHIFDEFYTTDISRSKGGSGLGLAIVKKFCDIFNYEIVSEIKEDKFIISLGIDA